MPNLATESLTLRVQAEQIAQSYLDSSRIGRPNNLAEPDKIQTFLASIRDGNYRETACKASGLSKGSLYRLLEQADHGDEAAQAFRHALEKAEGDAESETVRNVRQASKLPQFWAAGMTYLERKHPERWGKRQDDASTPKVMVQIGTGVTDITVNVLSVQAHDNANSLMQHEMSSNELVNHNGPYQTLSQDDSIPALEGELGAGSVGGPSREAGATVARKRMTGQSARRGAGKKKG